MQRFWPAVGLFLALLMFTLVQAGLLRSNSESIIKHLEEAEKAADIDDWDAAAAAFGEAAAHWERSHNLYAFVVHQGRVSDIAVQWRRAGGELGEKGRGDFPMENAALIGYFTQLLHDSAVAWYNVL